MLLQVRLCGGLFSKKGDCELGIRLIGEFDTTCTPDPTQMSLSSVNEKPEGQLGLAGVLSGDSWAGSGDLALRAPPAEICLVGRAWALAGGPSLGAG